MSGASPATKAARESVLRQASRHPLAHRVLQGLERAGVSATDPLVLAVSGGGDSIAMLALVAALRHRTDPTLGSLAVVSIDHGLRPANREECACAMATAHALGIACAEVRSVRIPSVGNVLDAAREARLAAIAAFVEARCAACGAGGGATERPAPAKVLFAHQADDRAEGMLLALARGAGVDALCSLLPARAIEIGTGDARGAMLELCRPLLDIRRTELREFLAELSIVWCDDPSNAMRARGALRSNPETAMLVDRIAASAGHAFDEVREMVEHRDRCARAVIAEDGVSASRARLEACPAFVQREVARILVQAAGGTPNRAAIDAVAETLRRGERAPKRHRCEGGVELRLDARELRAITAG